MRTSLRRWSFGAVLSAVALLAAPTVKADVIPVFDAATAVSGGTQFSYTASLSTGSKLFTNDYFTIYDFAGYVAGSEFAPSDWSVEIQNVGVTPTGQNITDDPNVTNLTFRYIGATTLVGPINPLGGAGAFGAVSIYSAENAGGTYTSFTHKNNPGKADDNTEQSNQGSVVTPQVVPEGSAMMMWAFGLVPFGMLARRRNKK